MGTYQIGSPLYAGELRTIKNVHLSRSMAIENKIRNMNLPVRSFKSVSFLQFKSAHLFRATRNVSRSTDDVEKNWRFKACSATYPHQLSKTLPCKHIPIPGLSKKLTRKHIHNPYLSNRFTCKHIHSPKTAENPVETAFQSGECKLKALNALLKCLNYLENSKESLPCLDTGKNHCC